MTEWEWPKGKDESVREGWEEVFMVSLSFKGAEGGRIIWKCKEEHLCPGSVVEGCKRQTGGRRRGLVYVESSETYIEGSQRQEAEEGKDQRDGEGQT